MAKGKNVFIEANGSTTYTAADVREISAAMRRLTEATSKDEKREFLKEAGILNKHGKLAKEYGG